MFFLMPLQGIKELFGKHDQVPLYFDYMNLKLDFTFTEVIFARYYDLGPFFFTRICN